MAKLNPYISFKDQARPALELYQRVLGGDLRIMTYAEMPGMEVPEGEGDLVMHGQLDTPAGLTLMASDAGTMMPHQAPTPGVTVALTGTSQDDLAYVRSAFEALAADATDVLPFELAPWGDHYGQLTDRFGVSWMFDVGTQ